MATTTPGSLHLAPLPEFRLLASFWGSMLAVDVARAVGASPLLSTLLVGGVLAACCLGQPRLLVLPVGLVGWLFVTGFVANDGGDLRLAGAGDLDRLLVLLACAGLGCLAGRRRSPGARLPVRRDDAPRRTSPEGARLAGSVVRAGDE